MIKIKNKKTKNPEKIVEIVYKINQLINLAHKALRSCEKYKFQNIKYKSVE